MRSDDRAAFMSVFAKQSSHLYLDISGGGANLAPKQIYPFNNSRSYDPLTVAVMNSFVNFFRYIPIY